jgi:hypothetical protein
MARATGAAEIRGRLQDGEAPRAFFVRVTRGRKASRHPTHAVGLDAALAHEVQYPPGLRSKYRSEPSTRDQNRILRSHISGRLRLSDPELEWKPNWLPARTSTASVQDLRPYSAPGTGASAGRRLSARVPVSCPSAAYGRNQTMDAFSPSYHCDCLNFTSHEHGRERMQEFTAKYADKIQGF